jgi:predicted enzyme related to lactoylglutathione lyase
MALDLYMVGLVPRNMDKSLEFYRRLDVDLSELMAGQAHFKSEMKGDITFFLNDMGLVNEADKPRLILEFYLKERAAVDAKYHKLTGHGYQSYRAPFVTPFGTYFAMISDPDGNVVLLSAD